MNSYDQWYYSIGEQQLEQALDLDPTIDQVDWLNDAFTDFTSEQEDLAYHSYKDDLLMKDNT